MSYCVSFPPISTPSSRVLILGSMPGVKSLEQAQYYAHPQNAFWKIMTALFGMPVETYPQRKKLIEQNDLALWDVLKCCIREGSLDSAIDPETIEINDFKKFLKKHSSITDIFLNGGTAAKEFKKRVLPVLPQDIASRINIYTLPSTSPAHAGMKFQDKLKQWQQVKKALGN